MNWLEEVTKRQDQLLNDLFRLLRIDSVRDDDRATPEAPVGPGPKKALEEFMKMAEEDGFKTEQFGPWAGHVVVGEGSEIFGILGHLDVVPVGSGWQTDPFDPQVIDGRIYARGASDDKGPTIAAYFAIKLLRELGKRFNKRIHLIVGTDEESDWQDMEYYFDQAPMPDFGISPDANFPIVNGEKGNTSAIFEIPVGAHRIADYTLESFDAGLRPNMVPQDARAVLTGYNLADVAKAFEQFTRLDLGVTGSFVLEEDQLMLKLTGKAAHGSTPAQGVNAATYLANFLANYAMDRQGADDFIDILTNYLHLDFEGDKIGVAHHDPVMGDVSVNVGIAHYSAEKGGVIDANMRYPRGTSAQTMARQIKETINTTSADVHLTNGKIPHYVPMDDPMVQVLLDVYESQTGLQGHEQVIGGGTFARLMPRGVAYGALFPDSVDTMHQANEFITIADLLKATAIYAEAIDRLACDPDE